MNTQNVNPQMATIWKYPIAPDGSVVHEIPKGAKALHMGPDPKGYLCVWFMVDPSQPMENRAIVMVGTGHSLPLNAAKDYVGTFVMGEFVNHVFVPCVDEDNGH